MILPAEFAASKEPGKVPLLGNSSDILNATVAPIPPKFLSTALIVNNLKSWSAELNPFPVDPIPILIFSIKTLSPTTIGKESAVLNPTDRVTKASFVMVLNPTVLIPTPLLFSIGIIVGE